MQHTCMRDHRHHSVSQSFSPPATTERRGPRPRTINSEIPKMGGQDAALYTAQRSHCTEHSAAVLRYCVPQCGALAAFQWRQPAHMCGRSAPGAVPDAARDLPIARYVQRGSYVAVARTEGAAACVRGCAAMHTGRCAPHNRANERNGRTVAAPQLRDRDSAPPSETRRHTVSHTHTHTHTHTHSGTARAEPAK